MSQRSQDQQWVAQAAQGDQRAFRALYRAHVRPVYWVALGIVGEPADAEDVTQETFITAWDKLPAMELHGTSVLPWLATICRFHAANSRRRRGRERERTAEGLDERLPDTVSVEDQVISADLAARIVTAMESLSELDRQIFRLCAVEGYAYQSAAEQLGVTHPVVRNRLSRVRTRLRGTVEEMRDA